MNTAQMELFNRLMDDYHESLSNSGCNDFVMPDTPEYEAVARDIIAASDYPDSKINRANGEIYLADYDVLDYIRQLVGLLADFAGNQFTPEPSLPTTISVSQSFGEPMTIDLSGLPAHRARLSVTFSNGNLPSILGKWVEVNDAELEALRITLEAVAKGQATYLAVEASNGITAYIPKATLETAIVRLEVKGINE